jgi:hypothetical protein
VKVADAADIAAIDLDGRVAETVAAHVGVLVAKDGRVERLAALEVAAQLLVPAHRPGLVHDLRPGERAGLPDAEHGTGRIHGDRHPAGVHDVHRFRDQSREVKRPVIVSRAIA